MQPPTLENFIINYIMVLVSSKYKIHSPFYQIYSNSQVIQSISDAAQFTTKLAISNNNNLYCNENVYSISTVNDTFIKCSASVMNEFNLISLGGMDNSHVSIVNLQLLESVLEGYRDGNFEVKLTDIGYDQLGTLKTEYATTIQMSSAELQRITAMDQAELYYNEMNEINLMKCN